MSDRAWLAAMSALVLALVITLGVSAPAPAPTTLPPCPTEDSVGHDCYWNARTMGNGQGRSFVSVDGRVFYLAPAGG